MSVATPLNIDTPRLAHEEDDVRVHVVKKQKRPAYQDALSALLDDAPDYVRGERPRYYVMTDAGFFDRNGFLHVKGAELFHKGQPNDSLEPLNEAARLRVRAWEATFEKNRMTLDEVVYEAMRTRPRDDDGDDDETSVVGAPPRRANVAGMTDPKKRELSDETEAVAAPLSGSEAARAEGNAAARKRGRPTKPRGGYGDIMPEDP